MKREKEEEKAEKNVPAGEPGYGFYLHGVNSEEKSREERRSFIPKEEGEEGVDQKNVQKVQKKAVKVVSPWIFSEEKIIHRKGKGPEGPVDSFPGPLCARGGGIGKKIRDFCKRSDRLVFRDESVVVVDKGGGERGRIESQGQQDQKKNSTPFLPRFICPK